MALTVFDHTQNVTPSHLDCGVFTNEQICKVEGKNFIDYYSQLHQKGKNNSYWNMINELRYHLHI